MLIDAMSPRKLTDHDKEELLVAYRETTATTSTLAARYGVSSSTISRLLKSRLSSAEYEELIHQKRLGRSGSSNQVEKETPPAAKATPKAVEKPKLIRRIAAPEPEAALDSPQASSELPQGEWAGEFNEADDDQSPAALHGSDVDDFEDDDFDGAGYEDGEFETDDYDATDFDDDVAINPDLLALAQEIQLGDRQQALKELLGDDIGEDDDFDDEEDFDDEDEDDDETLDLTPVPPSESVEILPLEAAQFPRTCYVVTDRLSELIARPMGEFRDLGHLPDGETSQRTLPIFDNHRVAKRFIRGRTQKIIKIPNGELFFKTSSCLASKGITRLLLDGKVYQLS
ncbi:hypothetical protein [Picosynechococcus sp. NKBG15041c]|uniref:hypothetical protein n=1 Tax=Picosynechococcus sp. NKBG15041c TaxID=1407650 RepID=UPI001F2AF270|nr:hypothetical protein [Picosynechococcus sp. NKBG15041c]